MRTLLALLLSGVTALGAITTNYVATDGNNSNPGTFELPWRNIGYGMSNMVRGGVLILRGGAYVEPHICDHDFSRTGTGFLFKDGYPGQRTTIKSYPGERAVFFPTNKWCSMQHGTAFASAATDRPGPSHMTFDGFTIDLSMRESARIEGQQNAVNLIRGNHILWTNMYFLNVTNGTLMSSTSEAEPTWDMPWDARWGNSNHITHCVFSNVWNVDIDGDGRFGPAHHGTYMKPAVNLVIEHSRFLRSHSVGIGLGSDHYENRFTAIVTNAVIRYNYIADCAWRINLRRSYHAKVYNNVIERCGIGTQPWAGWRSQNTYSSAIWLHGKYNHVANNTIYNCWDGISLNRNIHENDSLVHANIIDNNIIWNIGGWGLDWMQNQELKEDGTFRYPTVGTNTFRNNLTQTLGGDFGWQTWWADQIMSGNKIGTGFNPQFLDPPDDLRFAADSPARGDAFDLSAYFTTDYNLNTRTVPWDMGAFIFNSTPSGGTPPIVDPDPLPLVSVIASGVAYELGEAFATYTISRAGSLDGNLNVVFTMSGTAESNVNYTLSHSSPMTIANAEASAVITLTPVNVGNIGSQTAILTIGADAAYTVGSVNTATNLIIGSGQAESGFRRTFGSGAAMGRRGL
jgi:hypothetical protein